MADQDESNQSEEGISSSEDASLKTRDLLQTVQAHPDLSQFRKALAEAGLEGELTKDEMRTVFAPVNDAFKALPESFREEIHRPDEKDRLAMMLRRHIVEGGQTRADLRQVATARSIPGAPIEVRVDGGTLRFGTSRVIIEDIPCTNGYLHVIDSVVLLEYSYSG